MEEGYCTVVAVFCRAELEEEFFVAADDQNKAMIAEAEAFLLVHVLDVSERQDQFCPRSREETSEAEFAIADIDLPIQGEHAVKEAEVCRLQFFRCGQCEMRSKPVSMADIGFFVFGVDASIVGYHAFILAVVLSVASPHA